MKTIPNNIFFEWAESELSQRRNVCIRVKGNSMKPFLRSERDEVLLSPCQPSELKSMDVVLFKYRGRHVLHRIIIRNKEKLLLRGDGVYNQHEECTTADVLGIVKVVRRDSKREFSTENLFWKYSGRLWAVSYPLRRQLIRLMNWLREN